MDVLNEIRLLLDAKQSSENSIGRRNSHIKWLWAVVIFILTSGTGWIIAGTLWYAKMEHVSRAVDQIYVHIFGVPMP